MGFECPVDGLWSDECPYEGIEEAHPADQRIARVVREQMERGLGMSPLTDHGERFVSRLVDDLMGCLTLMEMYKAAKSRLHTELGMHGYLDFHGKFAAAVSSRVVDLKCKTA